MQELLKTQRISIAVLIVGLLLLIGLMVKQAPKSPFTMEATEMLANMPDFEHVTGVMAKNMNKDTSNYIFVDLRSPYDFEVKHIDNAINIPTAFILDDEHKSTFNHYLKNNITVILYGQTERESIGPWVLLTEIGYGNIKILLGGFECYTSHAKKCNPESAQYNYAKISTSGGIQPETPKVAEPVKKKKKVIPVKKKKKREAEGGC